MMFFLIELIIFISLAVILYLVGAALPRVDKKPLVVSRRTHWVISRIEAVDEFMNAFFEKFLRRVKVSTLKFDNSVSKKLETFRKDSKDDSGPGLGV